MPINFPDVPTIGDTYASGDRTWQWSGDSWDLVMGNLQIANNAVTNAKISNSAVTNTKLATDSVTSDKIAANAVITTSLASGSVTQDKLADRSVGSAELDNLTINARNATTYTLVLTDAHKLVTFSNSAPTTVTVPNNTSVAFDIGDQVNLLQLGSGQVEVVASSGVTIDSSGNKKKLFGQYAVGTLVKVATNGWVFLGNIAE